jgi:hypothetical protein
MNPAQTPQWELVNGVQVLKVWQLEGKKVWPQVVIVRLSNSQYQKFSDNPEGFMQFVNQNKLYLIDVIKAGPWVTLSSVEGQAKPKEWLLTLMHGKQSTLIVGALPKLVPPKKPKPK